MSDAFDADLGLYQGRIQPTGTSSAEGDWVLCLGHDVSGTVRSLLADSPFGDFQNIARAVDFTGDTYLTQQIYIRPPTSMPVGLSWVFSITAGADSYTVPIKTGGRARQRIDLTAQVAHLGVSNLSYAIALVGPGPAEIVEVELPGVYLDAVIFDTAADAPRVHQRDPEPNDIAVPVDSTIDFVVSDSTLSGVIYVALRVDGTLIYDSGTAFLAPGWGLSTGSIPAAFTLTYSFTPPGPFASSATVDVSVDASIGLEIVTTSWSFVVEDVIAPVLLSVVPLDHQLLEATFNEPVFQQDAANANDALNPANYVLSIESGTPAVLPAVIAVAAGGSPSTVRLTLDKAMTGGAIGFPITYRMTVSAVEDTPGGNPIQAPLNTVTFLGFACPAPPGRDIDLYRSMPELNRAEDGTGDLRKWLAIFQDPADFLFCAIDRWTRILDPDVAPEPWVDLMLVSLGNQFTFTMTLVEKRKLVKLLIEFAKRKGTGPGIVEAIKFFTGVDVALHVGYWAPYGLDDPKLKLDETFILGGGSQADIYTFEVRVPVILTAEQRARTIEVIEVMKAAHEHYKIIEPAPPVAPPDHWQLGSSQLAETTILH